MQYEALNFYGQNLVGTEGADWKRHRKVAKPAFNEAGNAFVWMETIRVINEWFMELDAVPVKRNTDAIAIDVVKDLVQVALLVISSAGFGRRASWQEDSTTTPPSGHKFAFRHAVTSATEHIHAKVLTPDWMYHFPNACISLHRAHFERHEGGLRCFEGPHVGSNITIPRLGVGGKVSNMDAGLLRNLVEANMMQEDDMHSTKSLTDDELLSTPFFAIALLALHPDVQNKIYEEALRLWPNAFPTTASASSYKDSMPNLQYTLAAFYETIRLFPPVIRLCKIAQADAHLTAHRFARNAKGEIANVEAFPVPVSAGSMVMIDIRGLGRNPMYWGSDCEDFKPERFVDTDSYRWPRDAFVSFSAGPRNCIGQRFATTESVCALASLVRNYEILIPDNLKGKSLDEQKASLLKWKPGATIVPTDCFVQLRRRPSV
ncbi:cytochrome P450 [Mycena sp. CBHHK59/15]|nr:cytochrome P450 [Mycena sp. CBHHK59/15]